MWHTSDATVSLEDPLAKKLSKAVSGLLLLEQELQRRTHSRKTFFVTPGGFYQVDLPKHVSADIKEDLKYSFAKRHNLSP